MPQTYWRATYTTGVTLAFTALDRQGAYAHAQRMSKSGTVVRIDQLDAKPEDLGKFVYSPS